MKRIVALILGWALIIIFIICAFAGGLKLLKGIPDEQADTKLYLVFATTAFVMAAKYLSVEMKGEQSRPKEKVIEPT